MGQNEVSGQELFFGGKMFPCFRFVGSLLREGFHAVQFLLRLVPMFPYPCSSWIWTWKIEA